MISETARRISGIGIPEIVKVSVESREEAISKFKKKKEMANLAVTKDSNESHKWGFYGYRPKSGAIDNYLKICKQCPTQEVTIVVLGKTFKFSRPIKDSNKQT